jgi:hypothetical protein
MNCTIEPDSKEAFMDTWTFGLTMVVVGMGGTLLSLMLMSLLMALLKRLFPLREEKPAK